MYDINILRKILMEINNGKRFKKDFIKYNNYLDIIKALESEYLIKISKQAGDDNAYYRFAINKLTDRGFRLTNSISEDLFWNEILKQINKSHMPLNLNSILYVSNL